MKKIRCLVLVLLGLFYFHSAYAQNEAREEAFEDAGSVSEAANRSPAHKLWRVSYFGLGSVTTKAFTYGNPTVGSYNYLGVTYKTGKDTGVSVRVAFIQNFAGNADNGDHKPQETFLSDAHIVYSDYHLLDVGPVTLGASFKFYFPTSETSQATHMVGKFRPEMYWEWAYAGYSSLTYIMKPDYYFQRQTAYISSTAQINTDGSYIFDPRKTNRIASIEHYLEWDLNINRYLSFLPSAGFADEWYYGSAAEGLDGGHDTKSRIAVGFEVRPMRGFDFTLLLQNNASLIPSRGQTQIRLFHPDDNQVVLMTNLALF